MVDLETLATTIARQALKDAAGNAPEVKESIPKVVPRGSYLLLPKGIRKARHPNRLTLNDSIAVYCDEKEAHCALHKTFNNVGIAALTGCSCVMEVSNNPCWVMETRHEIAQ